MFWWRVGLGKGCLVCQCVDLHVEEITEACDAGVCAECEPFRNEFSGHGQVQSAVCSMRRIGIPRRKLKLKLGGGRRQETERCKNEPYAFVHPGVRTTKSPRAELATADFSQRFRLEEQVEGVISSCFD